MPKKRNRLEIIYDMLDIIKEHGNSIKPTPLLRFSNMSSQRFDDYYSELLEKGFIKEVYNKQGRKLVALTDKGDDFLRKYRMILGIVEEFDL